MFQVRSRGTREKTGPLLFVEQDQPHRIPLLHHQIRQRCGRVGCILQFREPSGRREAHRCRCIHDKRRPEVCFFLELLDVEPIRLAVRFPVNAFNVITRHVRTVFRELNTETVIRALVKSGHVSLYHKSGSQLH